MPDICTLAGLGSAALVLAGGAALPLLLRRHRRRLMAAEAEVAALHQRSAARDRALGLLTQDLQAAGLSLLGQAAAAAQARRLLRLSDELSEALAVEARPRGLRPEIVPLLSLLEEAVANTAAMLVPGRREWRLARADFALLALRVDPRALSGALLPVLARAARTTREGDWIGLRRVLTADALAIVVEDEGAGLAAADLTVPGPVGAVQPGDASALPPSPPAQTRGLDFGLAAARGLLEAHGGGLRMESLKDIGARAWLTLPRSCVVEAEETTSVDQAAAGAAVGTRIVPPG